MKRGPLKKPADAPRGVTIQSLQRGLKILEIVARNSHGLTMAEVSKEISLHPSTTFHLLRTLTTLGYLGQDEATKRYHVGSKIFHLAVSAWTESQILNIAKPLLVEMARATGETSHLAVLERNEVIVIDKIDGSSPVRLTERVGYPRPPHCTAIGKVLLAYLPEIERRSFLVGMDLRPVTPKTITSIPVLEKEWDRVRDQGYAFDDEEFVQGIRCLAAPVRNFTGHVVAAIGISGPVWRVTLDRVAELTQMVKGAANRLSKDLGHSDNPGDAPESSAMP